MMGRSHWDPGALAAAISRPGIDPRLWLVNGVVKELGYDAKEGHFAEIRPMPNGDLFTAYIGSSYAGNDFGMSFPIEVGDTVLCAIPRGEIGSGAWVIARRWDAFDLPPAESADETRTDEPTQDVLIKVKTGQKLRIIVDGSGADVVIDLRGNSKCRIGPDGETFAAAGAPRTDDEITKIKQDLDSINQTLTTMKTTFDAHTHAFLDVTPAPAPVPSVTLGPSSAPAMAAPIMFPAAPTAHTPESVACDQVEIH